MTRSCGFRESGSLKPHRRASPVYFSCVNAITADPRLLGRPVRRIVYTKEQIAKRVQELGAEITAGYPDGELLVLGLLKGSFIFLSDLVREVGRPLQVDFLVASSYGDRSEEH